VRLNSKPQVIGLWNQAHPGDWMERVTEKVQQWFQTEATARYKWDDAHFSGNGCQLRADIPRQDIPE
jgi:hypothetical protein